MANGTQVRLQGVRDLFGVCRSGVRAEQQPVHRQNNSRLQGILSLSPSILAMRKVTRFIILFYGLLETFIFTGNIFGWTALHYMLRHQGVYEHLCDVTRSGFSNDSHVTAVSTSRLFAADIVDEVSEVILGGHEPNTSWPEVIEDFNETLSGGVKRCEAQDRLLNLAFTVGSFCIGSTAFIWGFLLDTWGLRAVRLIINGLVTSGTVLLSLTGKETSYLVFPALSLMCLAGVPLRLANIQIANLFPKQRATIITLYSGAFSASASVFVFIKYGFDAGLPWGWACFLLVAFSVLMLPVTLFLLPADRVREPTELKKGAFFSKVNEVAVVAPSIWGKFTLLSGSPELKRKMDVAVVMKSPVKTEMEALPASERRAIPLRQSLFSISYLLHQYWFCWLLLYTIVYVGTLHLWSERISNDRKQAAMLSEVYGLFQVTGLFLAPLGGVFMDWSIQQAAQESDPEVRRLQILRSSFWPMLITTMTEAVVQACKFFNSILAVYISVVFVTLLRAFFLAIGTAYLRIRFPPEHFNKLLGIMSTMSAVFTLLQFPLFLWEAGSPENVLYVNIFDSVCLSAAFVHPLLLLITPLQKYFINKEKETAAKYQGN